MLQFLKKREMGGKCQRKHTPGLGVNEMEMKSR